MATKAVYRGVFPVAPTVFDGSGDLDLEGQKRCTDFMIDAGSQGMCILANWSEQFVLTDDERERVMDCVLAHVAGRVPVIVTTTHFGSQVCAERSRRAEAAGAAMVMVMPPYHGATIRASEQAIYDFFRRVSDAVSIPIMIQDAPVAGTPLSVPLLARMARGDDRRRLSRRHPPDHGSVRRRRPRSRRGGLSALAAADQLREPAMRAFGGKGADAGGRRNPLRNDAAPGAAAASGNPRRIDRGCAAH